MNYIAAVNYFWDSATLNPLSTGQVSLYFALLHINNRSNWAEWFTAPNQVLSVLTGLSRSGILKARNELRQRGLIDFRERGTKATTYKVTIANSTQDGVQIGVQISTQEGVQDSTQNSNTLNKHKYKPKQEKKIIKEKCSPSADDNALFERLWLLYPEKKGKGQVSDAQKIRIADIGEEHMIRAIERYKSELEKDKSWRKPQNGSTFFTSGYVDCLDGNFVPSERKPEREQKSKNKNGFHNLEEHGYDYEKMVWDMMNRGNITGGGGGE